MNTMTVKNVSDVAIVGMNVMTRPAIVDSVRFSGTKQWVPEWLETAVTRNPSKLQSTSMVPVTRLMLIPLT